MKKTERFEIANALLHAAETLEACGPGMGTGMNPTAPEDEPPAGDEHDEDEDLAMYDEDLNFPTAGDNFPYGDDEEQAPSCGQGQTSVPGINYEDEDEDPVDMDESIKDDGTMYFDAEDLDGLSDDADEDDVLAASIQLRAARTKKGWVAHAQVPNTSGFVIAASGESKTVAMRNAAFLAAAYMDLVETDPGIISAAKKITPTMRRKMAQKAKKNATKGKKVFTSVSGVKKARKGGWKATAVFSRKGIKGKDGKPRSFTQQIRLGGDSKPILKVQGGKLMITTKDSKTGKRGSYQYGAKK